MGVSEKTSKASSVVAVLCIFVYIAAIGYGAWQIVMDMEERRTLAEKEFADLTDRASVTAVFLGFMSEAYQKAIGDSLRVSSTLLGIIITGSAGEFAIEKTPGSGIVWNGNSPRFRVGVGISSEPLSLPLRIEGQRNIRIQGIYSYINYNLFQKVLRTTLLAVLAALIVAFLTLLVELNTRGKAKVSKTKTPEMPVTSSMPEKETTIAEKQPETQPPQGLYAPKGNIGWESYTHDRLASELHRCSSFEQDLIFLMMEFPVPLPVYRQFADEAVSFFYMRDLIFEKGENGISIILPNMDLDHAITKADEFRSRISSKLPGSFEERSELCIGLTSRAGRLVDAKRLMLEASGALEKALADEVSHVVAFKSDPEKYRNFIRQQHKA